MVGAGANEGGAAVGTRRTSGRQLGREAQRPTSQPRVPTFAPCEAMVAAWALVRQRRWRCGGQVRGNCRTAAGHQTMRLRPCWCLAATLKRLPQASAGPQALLQSLQAPAGPHCRPC